MSEKCAGQIISPYRYIKCCLLTYKEQYSLNKSFTFNIIYLHTNKVNYIYTHTEIKISYKYTYKHINNFNLEVYLYG